MMPPRPRPQAESQCEANFSARFTVQRQHTTPTHISIQPRQEHTLCRWTEKSALIHVGYVFLRSSQVLAIHTQSCCPAGPGKAQPNQLFLQALPTLPVTAKVGEAEAEGFPGSIIQQITGKMAQMVHFGFKINSQDTFSSYTWSVQGKPSGKKIKMAVMFKLQAGIPFSLVDKRCPMLASSAIPPPRLPPREIVVVIH